MNVHRGQKRKEGRGPIAEQGATTHEPAVSVVIGIRNWGIERLKLALRSHKESSLTERVEVVVSDFGSENCDEIARLCSELGCLYVYSEAPVWSRSQALNAGVAVSRGPLVVTSDADIIFAPSTLETVLHIAEQIPHAVHLVQCRDLPPSHSAENFEYFDWREYEGAATVRPRWGMGGLAAFPRSLFDRIRGYEERMIVWGAEDNDFVKRCRLAGYPENWIDDPGARIYHMWHEPFLASGDGAKEIFGKNQDILRDDHSIIRNLSATTYVKTRRPAVSIVIATANRAEYLRESIDSCLRQTFTDFEVVVVDDGSTDHTSQIVDGVRDRRLQYYRLDRNMGVAAARNFGNRKANGAYIAVHDDDDIMLPGRLEAQLGCISAGVDGSYGGWVDFNGRDVKIFPGKVPFGIDEMIFSGEILLHPTLLLDAIVARQFNYDEEFRSGSDYNVATRLAFNGIRLAHCGELVVLRRIHNQNMTKYNAAHQKSAAAVTKALVLSSVSSQEEKLARERSKALSVVKLRNEAIEAVQEVLPKSAPQTYEVFVVQNGRIPLMDDVCVISSVGPEQPDGILFRPQRDEAPPEGAGEMLRIIAQDSSIRAVWSEARFASPFARSSTSADEARRLPDVVCAALVYKGWRRFVLFRAPSVFVASLAKVFGHAEVCIFPEAALVRICIEIDDDCVGEIVARKALAHGAHSVAYGTVLGWQS